MQALSDRELIALLNWQLAAYEECDGCRFTSIRHMRSRDDAGANWLDARLHADHRLRLEEHFIAGRIVEQTRRRFEVAPS
jgi:hypothetical protein